ncbi:YEATS domain-containing protein 2 isoform X2 [Anabrus simplex]|uniref:YEATS domain-containing protein 2 isoform X2 n=1 Tax=Anabrus simplex TaxID=316456 RepID=UPI0035A2C146
MPSSQSSEQPKRIHPAIKKLLGKEPRLHTVETLEPRQSRWRPAANHSQDPSADMVKAAGEVAVEKEKPPETISKVPRYIPPKSSSSTNRVEVKEPRGIQLKVKKRLVIGNISKWIPIDTREDDASHKWMVYVRGPKEVPDVSSFVSKVRFFLHPSYRPHDVVDISTPPFHLARRGWGEFPVRVQIHFVHPLNKPVDIIHQLKLDQTRTGLQTLGAETVVDIWLHRTTPAASNSEAVEDDQPCVPQSNKIVEEQNEASDSVGVTLYEEDGHKTIVHDLSFVGANRIKEENIDSLDSVNNCENGAKLIKQEPNICENTSVPFIDSRPPCLTKKSDEYTEIKIKQEPEFCESSTENLVPFCDSKHLVENNLEMKAEEFHSTSCDLLSGESQSSDIKFSCNNQSVDIVHSFDHDYFNSSLPPHSADTLVTRPPEELVIGEEVIVSSNCELNMGVDSSFDTTSKDNPREHAARINTAMESVNTLEQVNHFNNDALPKFVNSRETENGRVIKNNLKNVISPSKSVLSHTVTQNNEISTCINNSGVTCNNTASKIGVNSESAGSLLKSPPLNSESARQIKMPPLSNPLSKPTTLVKCMDKSGNVFYITVGLPNTKSQSKVLGGTSVTDTSTGAIQGSIGDLKTNLAVSLLSNSLLTKETQQAQKNSGPLLKVKTPNSENTSHLISVSSPVMKSLITPKTSALSAQKLSPTKSVMNSVHNVIDLASKQGQSSLISGRSNSIVSNKTLSPAISNKFLNAKSIVKPQLSMTSSASSASMLEGITSVDCSASAASDQLQLSTSLIKYNVKMGNKLHSTQVVPDSRTSLSTNHNSKGNSHLNHQTQGQSLLLVKDGQIFLLKHTPTASTASSKLNVTTGKQSTVNMSHEELTKNHPSLSGTSNVATVLNSLVLQPQLNPGAVGVKVNQSVCSPRTLLSSAKPGVSLLKKNVVKTDVAEDLVKKEKDEKLQEEQRLLFSGRTLVLNKANRIVLNSKKPEFEEKLKEIISRCKFDDVQKSVSWLLRHFPLVHPDASQPEFRVLHPYTSPSETTFLQWNHGKRKAAEWQRAKAVQCALREGGFSEEEVWSTRNIVIWAKLHGHTPLSRNQSVLTDTKLNIADQDQLTSNSVSTYSEPVKIVEWLEANLEANRGSLEDDTEIDVVRLSPPTVRVKEEPELLEDLMVMDVSPPDMSDVAFVRDTARELGFKFSPEQIVPGVLYCAAERILVQAMRSFVEDLTRRSFRKAWERNSNRQPDSITLQDTREAILDRQEFDMFTNIGLGVQAADTG